MTETTTRPPCDVLVIGAGLAGLYAAMQLEAQGLGVTIVEASGVIGGRIRTVTVDGRDIDIGGTGLGPSHLRAHALVARFGLGTRPLTRRGKFAFSINGMLLDDGDWQNSPANLTVGEEREILPSRMDSYYMQTLLPFLGMSDWLEPAHAEWDIPFAEHLRRSGVSAEAMRLVNMCINTNDIETVSALSIFRDAIKWRQVGFDDPKNFDQYGDKLYQPIRLDGGMVALPNAMAASLKQPVMTNHKVERVEFGADGVTLHCTGGSTLRGRRAIVAVPLVTMRAITFDPPLPTPLDEAVAEAGASGNTQFILTADDHFWERDGFAPSLWSDSIFERLFVEFDADNRIDHLRIWINGDNAGRVDALGETGSCEALIETLARLRPSTAGHLHVRHRVSWGSEPLIGGEKYVMGPGQVTRFARDLATPVGPLHWAGEHHKSTEVGIEAALQSGERASAEVLASMRG